jgi:hypothetical protein
MGRTLKAEGKDPSEDDHLLQTFLKLEAATLQDPELRKIDALIKSGELMLAATMLRATLGERFRDFLKASLNSNDIPPSDVHRTISRLPFSLVITTNFDNLMERSYEPNITDELDRDPDEIMKRIRLGDFCIVKLHGTTDNLGQVVIDDNDYKKASRTESLRHCIELIFLTKTVLFIGHSLRDPDLTEKLYDLKVRFRDFGPHYAILNRNEVTPNYARYLRDTFNVRIIEHAFESPAERVPSLARLLSAIHGDVAKMRTSGDLSYEHRSSRNFETRISSLIENAASVLGAFRIDVCVLDNRRYSQYGASDITLSHPTGETDDIGPCLRFHYSWGPTDQTFRDITANFRATKQAGKGRSHRNPAPSIVWPSSVIWNSFYRDAGPQIISNVFDPELHKKHGYKGEYESRYRMGHSEVRSELTAPIESGGLRLGILNVESNFVDAFTQQHIQAAVMFAREIGDAIEALWTQDIALTSTFDLPVDLPVSSAIDPCHTLPGTLAGGTDILLNLLCRSHFPKIIYKLFRFNYHDGTLEEESQSRLRP